MNFPRHLDLIGQHAILGASQGGWLEKDKEGFIRWYNNKLAAERGTKLHDLAQKHIELGVEMGETDRTLGTFINDAIKLGMTPEQPLQPFPHCKKAFGTADAISFDEETNELIIFDLKTGDHPASMRQLKIYAAFFCLEFEYNPRDINIELRIYQSDNIIFCHPDAEEILDIMDRTEEKLGWIEELEGA